MVHIHNGILLSHKKEPNNAICNNIDATRDSHTMQSKSERDKYHMISFICGIYNLAQMNLSTEQKQTHRQGEQTCGRPGGGEGVGWTGSLKLVDANYYI